MLYPIASWRKNQDWSPEILSEDTIAKNSKLVSTHVLHTTKYEKKGYLVRGDRQLKAISPQTLFHHMLEISDHKDHGTD
jgi:hypothetical protein